ncbi:MAG TPA: F0F1 ATP synthase subunit A [Anaeromyxobacter sp.]|nr:F0F1 ATP synthase subunit A [Anaeromyxobacter sp.]
MKTPRLFAVVLAAALAGAGGRARAAEAGAGGAEPATDIGAVMLHHVADGYVLELPGACGGRLAWDCEIDLHRVFGGSLVFGAVDMTPTRHVVMMWLAAVLLAITALAAARRRQLVPRGLYNFVEVMVAFVRNEIALPNMGAEHADRFVPYLVTAFFFILFMNLLGLVPWSATATANLSVTVMMALFTFVITQATAIRSMGPWGFLKHLAGGVPASLWPLWFIMVPVEVMGLFTKPFALTVRLFANMVAGHFVILALLGLIFVISPWVAFGAVPMALGIFLLELFVALVQAYIFTMLSALFIGAGLAPHGGHGGGHGDGEREDPDSHVAGEVPGHG